MRKRKLLTFILMIILMISTVVQDTSFTNAVTTDPRYENGGTELYFDNPAFYDKIKSQLPEVTPGQKAPATITLSNGTKVPINYHLWTQKGLVVYGNYKSVPGNRFKCGYQEGVNPATGFPNEYKGGYYLVNLNQNLCSVHGKNCPDKDANSYVRGEWQYHGYDVKGNRFSDIAFINDANVTRFNQREWIKEPWSPDYVNETKLTQGISTYNRAAYQSRGDDVRKWIGYTLAEWGGVPAISGIDPEVYKYLYIQSAPTIMFSGSGRMWHQRPSSIWYQSLSVPVLTEKQQPQVTAEATKVTGQWNPTTKTSTITLPENEEKDNDIVYIDVTIKGILKDEEYYTDEVLRTTFYTRQDIKSWTFTTTIFGNTYTQDNVPINSKGDNTKTYEFVKRIPVTYAQIRSINTTGMLGTVTAQPTYENGIKGVKGTGYYGLGPAIIPEKPIPPIRDIPADVPEFRIGNNITEIAFDGVPFTGAVDNTDMSKVSSVSVFVNGQSVNYNAFFSGNYVFPATTDRNGYLAQVEVVYHINKATILPDWLSPEARQQYMDDIQDEYKSSDVVYVYPTKPNAHFAVTSNSWKENRIINVANDSPNSNIQLVLDSFPITQYRWSYGGDTSKLHYGTNTDIEKQLQYSAPGSYSLTLECQNALGKWSDPYTVQYTVLQDYRPNIEVNLTDSVITRDDTIKAWHYDVNSTDGDRITAARIELWYDSDNNGTVDTKVQEWNGAGDNGIVEKDDFPSFKPDKLGYYMYKVFANEDFVGVTGQDTLAQFVTAANKKSHEYDVEFWVDNYQPLADIYLNAPIERPNVDLLVMLDKNLTETKTDAVVKSRIDMENWLLGKNVIPNVSMWDLKTYTYSQDASTNYNSGSSQPPATYVYTSNGYTGTLTKNNQWDNGGYQDDGGYQTKTESQSFSASWANSCYTSYDKNGKMISNSDNPAPSSYSINSNGYAGSIPRTGTSQDGPYRTDYADGSYTIHNVWTAHYSGTLSKTVQVWVPDMRWHANWYGSYSGKIYKDIKQPYTDPYKGGKTNKYILYISDNVVSESADYNNAVSKADSKIILAGQPDIKIGNTFDYFIDATGKNVADITDDALNYIAQTSPAIEELTILQNQTFELHTGNFDLEGDPIVQEQLQYVHEADYYDNPTGQEPGTLAAFSETTGWTTTVLNKFSNVGRYRIMRRIKDLPTGSLGNQFSYFSGVSEVNILVHRRPIADAVLDWEYNAATNNCDTIWIDQSYDLDHTSMENKGIVERKIMFRRNGGEWQYYIPDTLSYGNYDVQYYVRDIEGAWSDPWVYSFTLDGNPQFTASARSLDGAFTLASIPASEYIEAYNLWTRQPSTVRLELTLTPTVSGLPATKLIPFQNGVTGSQIGQDISWNNQTLQIPDVFPDGPRTFTVYARDVGTGFATPRTFAVNVFTPINLVPGISGRTLNSGVQSSITAGTSKYPATTTVVMQRGTPYQSSTLNMTGSLSGNAKNWVVNYTIPAGVPDGTYTARFISTNPSGKSETRDVTYTVLRNRPPLLNITGTTPAVVYEGDDVSINFNVSDPDNDPVTCDVRLRRGPATVWTQNIVVSPVGVNYPPVSLPSLQDIPLGSYTIEITARDPYNATDYKTYDFDARIMTITGDVQPNPAMAGEKVTITASTEGYTERVIVTMWNGDTVELTPDRSTANLNNTWTGSYIVPLHTPDSTYPVNFTAIRGSINRQYSTNLTILGNLLDLVKPRIRDSN